MKIKDLKEVIYQEQDKLGKLSKYSTGKRQSLTLSINNHKKHLVSILEILKNHFIEGNVLQVVFMLEGEKYQVNLTNIAQNQVYPYLSIILGEHKKLEILEIKEIMVKDTFKLLSQNS